MQLVGQKMRFSTNIWLHRMHVVNCPTAKCDTHSFAGPWRRLLFAGTVDEMLMTRSVNVTTKTTEHNLIVRSGKSEATITNLEQ